jgi:anaphase-promoting complex subunit 2
MVRDVFSSRELNQTIRRSQSLEPSPQEIAAARTAPKTLNQQKTVSPEGLLKPSLHAKILSRLFWPSLHDDAFSLPPEIVHLQERYQAGFESVKNARKLTWLNALGQVIVELDLADRVVVEQVHTWQATVIYAFNEGKEDDKTQTHTVDELVEHLGMSESLVKSALKFWTEKFVLQEVEPSHYSVLETLSNADRERSNAQVAANIATGQSSSSGNVERDVGSNVEAGSGGKPEMEGKGEKYGSFIKGMLKNSATQMPVQQISMMLKMLMIDGFPYGDDELRAFLMRMVEKGELEVKGGKFKLKK